MTQRAATKPSLLTVTLSASVLLLSAVLGTPGICATTTANATANVMVPIAIAKVTDLAFGKFGAGTGGTVSINTAGTRSGTGVILSGSGATGAATFTVTGDPNATYAIDYSATSATLTKGADSMALALTSDLTGAGGSNGTVSSGLLSAGGSQTLHVGGTLTVAASQAPGQYTGTVSAAVDYN